MTEKLIKELRRQYTKELLMAEVDSGALSTRHLRVMAAFAGMDPMSPLYGKIIGFFTAPGGGCYKFWFRVHEPGGARENEMLTLTEVREVTFGGCPDLEEKDTGFGRMAFWDDTPMAYLKKQHDRSHWMLRGLMENLARYSEKQGLCSRLRRSDAAALRDNPVFRRS